MFGKTFRLPFTLAGIPVQLDISFLLILPLLAYLIGSRVGMWAHVWGIPPDRTLESGAMPYVLGLIAALGLFICVVLHELGHALTARVYGVKVRNITLWFLGGVAQFESIPRQKGAEAIVGIAGPIVSFALAAGFFVLLQIPVVPALQFILAYLAATNVVIAVFNLLPALPLDGGRILRSLLALSLPYNRATQISVAISKTLAVALGLFALFTLQFFLLLIAIFVFLATSAESHSNQIESALSGARVADLMTTDVRAVPPTLTLEELSQTMLHQHHLGFPVVDDHGNLLGLVTIQHMAGQPPSATVADIMSRDIPTLAPSDDAALAFKRISEAPSGRIPVIDSARRLVGILTKTDFLHLFRLRSLTETSPPPTHLHPA